MILRLDPRIPMLWRDPFSVQFGVEPERVVLRDLTAAQERMIATLRIGVSDTGLAMTSESAGGTARDADELIARLDPVLDRPRIKERRRVAVVGTAPTAQLIARILAESGCEVSASAGVPPDEGGDVAGEAVAPALAVLVGHYVFDPALYSHWLRRDVPHLPVLFADGTATVGPLVEPGFGACLNCIEFYRRDGDERWAVLAAQLWGRRSAAETPLVSREIAALAARLALGRLGGASSIPTLGSATPSFRLDVETGGLTRTEWLPHPDCGCLDLASGSRPVSAVPRGIDSALSKRTIALRPSTRTARAAGGHG